MAHSSVILVAAATLALIAAAPEAYAQADEGADLTATEVAGATLDCTAVGLRIMTAEVSGARFVCRIAGAPAADSSFSVQVVRALDPSQTRAPVCSGNLAAGAGACIGQFVDRAASGLGQVRLAVTLEPSGTALEPVVIGPSTPAPAASELMQFYPLSEP